MKLTLYIVQAEEGSGIPGTPEVYLDSKEAEAAYDTLWREAWARQETPEEVEQIMEKAAADGGWFEDWPEDGGVRMWDVDIELPAQQ